MSITELKSKLTHTYRRVKTHNLDEVEMDHCVAMDNIYFCLINIGLFRK